MGLKINLKIKKDKLRELETQNGNSLRYSFDRIIESTNLNNES